MSGNDSLLFDVRLVEHHIRRGTTTREAYEKHLETVEDCSAEAVQTHTKFSNPFEQRNFPSRGAKVTSDSRE